MTRKPASSREEYLPYTERQCVDKAMHMLEGIVKGIAADGVINDAEMKALHLWLAEHRLYSRRQPFKELIPVVNRALLDSKLDDEEREDILWLCKRLATDEIFFDRVASDLQRLHGLLAGVMADGTLNEMEVRELRDWLASHEHLAGSWPYDEILSVARAALANGPLKKRERLVLEHSFADFVLTPHRKTVSNEFLDEDLSFMGVCVSCPIIVFEEKLFCFTGESKRADRGHLTRIVEQLGGVVKNGMSQGIDYLVVGADGNPCWAYACYGRKIEQAVKLRKSGFKVVIVHENDFWDAFEDFGRVDRD